MLGTTPQAVFLDACVFIGATFNMRSRDLRSLESLVANGTLSLVTTDIVVREVQAHIDEAVRVAKSRHDRFRRETPVLRGTQAAKAIVADISADTVATELQTAFSDYLRRNETRILTADAIAAGRILGDYFARQAPFGEGKRKDEFPDAFSLAAVCAWHGDENDETLVFVTADRAIADALRPIEYAEHFNTLRSLLDAIYSQDEARAHFLKHEILGRRDELKKWVADVFTDRTFYVDDRFEGEVLETRVERVDMTDDAGDLELVEMDKGSATFVTRVDVEFEADIKYGDDNMAFHDNEDGATLFMEYITETVTRRQEDAELEVQVSFDGLDPTRFEILEIDFAAPDTVFVETSQDEEWRRIK